MLEIRIQNILYPKITVLQSNSIEKITDLVFVHQYLNLLTSKQYCFFLRSTCVNIFGMPSTSLRILQDPLQLCCFGSSLKTHKFSLVQLIQTLCRTCLIQQKDDNKKSTCRDKLVVVHCLSVPKTRNLCQEQASNTTTFKACFKL